MPTLHIEHAIADFAVWSAAFERFSDMRATSGVRDQRVQQPIDDAHYVVIDLDFDTVHQAQAFLGFLQEKVWPHQDNAPALVGTPHTKILDVARLG